MPVHDRYQTYQSDQRDFFDALVTEDWASYENQEWDELRRFEISKLFEHIKPRTILDIGCGCGFHDQVMARYPFVRRVDGIDYSSQSIEKANDAYPHPKVTRWVSDLNVDRPDEKYDLVVSFQVFEHLEDTDSYFEFAINACEPGGIIAILMPNRTRLPNALRTLKGQKAQLCDPQHFREYSLKDIMPLAAAKGLKMMGSFGYGLNGLRFIDRMPIRRRLQLGAWFPSIANGLCVMMRADENSQFPGRS